VLERAVTDLVADPDRAAEIGRAVRKAALQRYGLPAFLRRWDDMLDKVR
jgi:hypothetical protein